MELRVFGISLYKVCDPQKFTCTEVPTTYIQWMLYTVKPRWVEHWWLIYYVWVELIPESQGTSLYRTWSSVARTTLARTNFLGPKGVQAIEVWLYMYDPLTLLNNKVWNKKIYMFMKNLDERIFLQIFLFFFFFLLFVSYSGSTRFSLLSCSNKMNLKPPITEDRSTRNVKKKDTLCINGEKGMTIT